MASILTTQEWTAAAKLDFIELDGQTKGQRDRRVVQYIHHEGSTIMMKQISRIDNAEYDTFW